MKLLYFAWIRERIGRTEEEVDPPPSVETVSDLLGWLVSRGDQYQHALTPKEIVRVALDRVHAGHLTPIGGAREVALFPPMTGG